MQCSHSVDAPCSRCGFGWHHRRQPRPGPQSRRQRGQQRPPARACHRRNRPTRSGRAPPRSWAPQSSCRRKHESARGARCEIYGLTRSSEPSTGLQLTVLISESQLKSLSPAATHHGRLGRPWLSQNTTSRCIPSTRGAMRDADRARMGWDAYVAVMDAERGGGEVWAR